jgi:hypothetical protein
MILTTFSWLQGNSGKSTVMQSLQPNISILPNSIYRDGLGKQDESTFTVNGRARAFLIATFALADNNRLLITTTSRSQLSHGILGCIILIISVIFNKLNAVVPLPRETPSPLFLRHYC